MSSGTNPVGYTLFLLSCVLLSLVLLGSSDNNQAFLCDTEPPTADYGQPPVIKYYFKDTECLPFNFTGQPHLTGATFDTKEDCEQCCIYGCTDPTTVTPPTTEPITDSPTQPPFITNDTCLLNYDPGVDPFPFDPVTKYYFNRTVLECQWFVYRGLEGNENRFDSKEECYHRCGHHRSSALVHQTVSTGIHVYTTSTQLLSSIEEMLYSGDIMTTSSDSLSILRSTKSSIISTESSHRFLTQTTSTDSLTETSISLTENRIRPTETRSTMPTTSDSAENARKINGDDSGLPVVLIYGILVGCFALIVSLVVSVGLVLCVVIVHRRRRQPQSL